MIRAILVATALFMMCGWCHAQDADPRAKASWASATATYPACTVEGSPLYNLLVKNIAELEKSNPAFFNSTDWPEILVRQCAPLVASTAAAAPAPPSSTTLAPLQAGQGLPQMVDGRRGDARATGLTSIARDMSGNIISGIDPATNERVYLAPGGADQFAQARAARIQAGLEVPDRKHYADRGLGKH